MIVLAAAATAAKAVQTTLPITAVPNAAAPAPLTAPVPHTWFAQHLGWLTHGIAGLFILAALALIVLLAAQTTKQEGLSGTIGGRVDSNYRGRPGAEEQLKRVTGLAATVFVVSGFLLALTGI